VFEEVKTIFILDNLGETLKFSNYCRASLTAVTNERKVENTGVGELTNYLSASEAFLSFLPSQEIA
jgi:hypothetical protein